MEEFGKPWDNKTLAHWLEVEQGLRNDSLSSKSKCYANGGARQRAKAEVGKSEKQPKGSRSKLYGR